MTLKVCVSMLAGSAMAVSAFAAPLAPGGTIFLPAAEADPSFASTLLASMTQTFNVPGFYSGTLDSAVLTNDSTNPFGLSGLTFVYRLNNDATSRNALARLTVNNFTGFLTDASWNPVGGGFDPLFIDRQGSGNSVGFSFSNALGHSLIVPGSSSTVLVIQTDATQYGTTFANVIDGAVVSVPTYSPIPTPGAAALMGLGAMAACRRRR